MGRRKKYSNPKQIEFQMDEGEKNTRVIEFMWQFMMDTWRPAKLLNVSDWADQNRILVSESSAEPGRWRTDRAPYQREIMNAFTDQKIHEIVVESGAQNGKSEILLNMMGRAIDVDPGPMLYVNPTTEFAKDFSKRRVAPMIDACPALKKKVYEARSRDSSNTIEMKTFPGGSVAFVGANSPTELAGRPIRYLFCDETDRYPQSAGTEGDPIALAEKRTRTFTTNRKIVKVSTPTIKGASKIEKAFKNGTQEEWATECPECKKFSFIQFMDIKFEKEEYKDENGDRDFAVSNVRWKCPECGAEHTESITKRQPAMWIAKNPRALEAGIRSFKLSAFMSPWSNWDDICRDFLRSKDDPNALQVFVNTELGEVWEVKHDDGLPEKLYARREHYTAEVPDGVLVLTMGVDTQDNRLEYEVVGWDRNEQSWGIERGVIPGQPDAQGVWEDLDGILDRDWERADGSCLRIRGTFIDSGGHYTQDVYREAAKRQLKRVWAIKGEAGESKFMCRLMKKENGAGTGVRYIVGVDSGKTAIMYSAQEINEPGPGYMHFPRDFERGYDIEYFKGLMSEQLVTHRKMGKMTMQWEQIYRRNEPLDCRNYARAVYKFTKWPFTELEKILGNGGKAPEKHVPTAKEKEKRKNRHVVSKGISV